MRHMEDEEDIFIEDEEDYGITVEEMRLGDYENDIDVEVHHADPHAFAAAAVEEGGGGTDSYLGIFLYAVLGIFIIVGILYINMRGPGVAPEEAGWSFKLRSLQEAEQALAAVEGSARDSSAYAAGLQRQLQRVADCLTCINDVVQGGGLSHAQLQAAEALLKRLDALLCKFHALSPQSDHSAHAMLEDYLLEATVSQSISLLRAESAAVSDAVGHLLGSHALLSLRKCVFDLQQDLRDGALFMQELRVQQKQGQALHIGESCTEFEVTTRRVVQGVELLRVFDTASAHDSLREQAVAYLRAAHALEDELSRRLFEAREASGLLLLKQNLTAAEDSSAGAAGSLFPGAQMAIDDVWKDVGEGTAAAQTNVVSLDSSRANRVDSAGSLPSSVSSEQVAFFQQLQAQGRVASLTDKFLRSAEETKGRRLEQRLRAESAAETRYRKDYQAERDDKARLAALAVQQALLRSADRQWVEQRKKELTEAYRAALQWRITRDVVVFSAVALLSTLVYAALAYGCRRELRLRDQLLAAARSVCASLATDCQKQQQAEPEALSLGDIDRMFKQGAYSDIPGLLMGQARLSSAWGLGVLQSLLGLSWDRGSLLAEFGLCFYQVCSKLLLPLLASKLFAFIGLPQAASMIVWAAVALTFVGPLRSLFSFLRQFSLLLGVQAVVFAATYLFDAKLRWHMHGKGSAAKAYNVRTPLLCVAYPLLFLAASLHLGAVAANESYSRGLRLGYSQQGLRASISMAVESIKQCLQN